MYMCVYINIYIIMFSTITRGAAHPSFTGKTKANSSGRSSATLGSGV